MTMNKSILHIITFTILTIFLASCVSPQWSGISHKAVKHADTFRNKIDKYEASRSQTFSDIEKAAQQTIKSLNSQTPDFGSISTYWEREWKSVHNNYNQLLKNFTKVVDESNKYFEIIDTVGSEIIDPKIKHAELKKNQELRKKWLTARTAADKHIKSLSQVIQAGDDFHKTMLGATLRARPEGGMDNIKAISEKANLLLEDLINLTTEGKNLVPSRVTQEKKTKENLL